MMSRNILIVVAAISIIAMPAMAQTKKVTAETNGHHYSGGPKTESHHMGRKDAGRTSMKSGPSGSHHYNGGPREPHHIGPR